jgi:3-deoxy-manno-octulosonate cytidylyltransferase (CMP-KDO synthetase)
MSFIVIIPARYESTRLPGKPLKDIAGTTMIQRVWQQACKSSASRVVIATDDQRIQQVASAFGAEVCMTRGVWYGQVAGSGAVITA